MSFWPVILSSFLSLCGALGGVVYTQKRADDREADRRADDTRREEARWAREDAIRSYEHRRAAYADFVTTWEGYVEAVIAGDERDMPPPEGSDWDPLYRARTQVQVFGTAKASAAASSAVSALEKWAGSDTRLDRSSMDTYLAEIRRDLAIPE